MVYWITGKCNSGKTTLAYKLAAQIPGGVVLDGDEMRSWFPTGFSDKDRIENQERLTRVACILEKQGFVPIIACVSPVKSVREQLQSECLECLEIQLPFGELWEGTTYEE